MSSSPTPTTTEERALSLLGQGLGPEAVASAVGVTVSRISQLLSQPEFASKVAELRYGNLAKHNTRDNAYDALEDTLVEKLKENLPFMMRPMEILKAISVVNAAKRRGSGTPDAIVSQQTVVQLIMPTQIIQSFTANTNNQVVRAGTQDLVTVQSSNMDSLLAKTKGTQNVNLALPSGATPNAVSS
jgi:hypothetical protein